MKNRISLFSIWLCLSLPVSGEVGDKFLCQGVWYQITNESTVKQAFEVSAVRYDSAYITLPDSITNGVHTYAVTNAIMSYNKETCALRHYNKIDLSGAKHITTLTHQYSQLIAVDTLILPPNLTRFPLSFSTLDSINGSTILEDKENLLPGIHRIYSTGTQALENIRLNRCTSLMEADISSYTSTLSSVVNPNNLFSHNPFLEKLLLPTTLTVFGNYMFASDSRLVELSIPDSLKSIKNEVFSGTPISVLRLGEKVETISPINASYNMQRIEVDSANPYYMAEDGVLYTKNQSVLWRYPVARPGSEYRMSPKTESIIYNAFSVSSGGGFNFDDLEEWRQMQELYALKTLVCSNTLKNIGDYAFEGSGITNFVGFSDTQVQSIPRYCFTRSAIQSISYPETLRKIGFRAFAETPDLVTVGTTLPPCLNSVEGEAFRDAWKLAELDFYACEELLEIPVSMCLNDSSLEYLALPRNLQTINDNAFMGCVSLREIVCPAIEPIEINASVFQGVNKNECVLKIPSCSLEKYKTADVWKEFFYIDATSMYYLKAEASDANAGIITGEGTYKKGEKATLHAISNEGFEFVQWSDGETRNPRYIDMTKDVSLVAEFVQKSPSDLDQITNDQMGNRENVKILRNGYLFILRGDRTYTITGQEMK
ncbi:MAG: leucine-rich repeat protein [Paludibacteraceae bacterium]|nr:leucine-rich repeat protein [Paludibacteraceae bacterium]